MDVELERVRPLGLHCCELGRCCIPLALEILDCIIRSIPTTLIRRTVASAVAGERWVMTKQASIASEGRPFDISILIMLIGWRLHLKIGCIHLFEATLRYH